MPATTARNCGAELNRKSRRRSTDAENSNMFNILKLNAVWVLLLFVEQPQSGQM